MNYYILYMLNFVLLFMGIVLFGIYYFKMIDIINPFKIVYVLEKEFIRSINHQNTKEAKEILESLSDVVIKSIDRNDAALATKYSQQLIGIYYEIQKAEVSVKYRVEIEEILFFDLN